MLVTHCRIDVDIRLPVNSSWLHHWLGHMLLDGILPLIPVDLTSMQLWEMLEKNRVHVWTTAVTRGSLSLMLIRPWVRSIVHAAHLQFQCTVIPEKSNVISVDTLKWLPSLCQPVSRSFKSNLEAGRYSYPRGTAGKGASACTKSPWLLLWCLKDTCQSHQQQGKYWWRSQSLRFPRESFQEELITHGRGWYFKLTEATRGAGDAVGEEGVRGVLQKVERW